MLLFAIDLAASLSVVIGIIGICGLIFTALSYGRNDTTQVVNQQAAITQEMKTLIDEQRIRGEEVRKDLEECRMEGERMAGQIEELRAQARRGR